MSKGARIAGSACTAAGMAVASYPLVYRNRCLTWGATPDEVTMNLPGDELLPGAELVTTRAVSISAPPRAIWPWLVQMGSGRGGAYTYDWAANLLGMGTHSANEILPQFQETRLGDELPLGPRRGMMRVEVFQPERVLAIRFQEGTWVWIFALLPEAGLDGHPNGQAEVVSVTRLISRNRMNLPTRAQPARAIYALIMEPGSLVMERKMLLGIKARAERLAHTRQIPVTVSG